MALYDNREDAQAAARLEAYQRQGLQLPPDLAPQPQQGMPPQGMPQAPQGAMPPPQVPGEAMRPRAPTLPTYGNVNANWDRAYNEYALQHIVSGSMPGNPMGKDEWIAQQMQAMNQGTPLP